MDRETAIEIERLKASDADKNRRIKELEEAKKSWDRLVRDTVIHTIKWLMLIATAGILSGWHLSENIRKTLTEWLTQWLTK